MPLDNPRGGIGYAVEFQSSALPWCTSSVAPIAGVVRFDFPRITRFISIVNFAGAGSALRLGFTANGVTGSVPSQRNFIRVPGSSSLMGIELRVSSIFVCSDTATTVPFDLLAGLTNIDARQMPEFTGSINGTGSWSGIG